MHSFLNSNCFYKATPSLGYSSYLYFPQSFRTGCRRGRLPPCRSQEDVLLLPVLIASQKLLLFCMEQPHHIPLPKPRHGQYRHYPSVNKLQASRALSLTPLRISSLLSLHFMKRTIFQLVLQFTELTYKEN